MLATILRDPDAAKKLLDTIADSPTGRRSISRLSRTCKAICEPALDVLWRELDSFLPLVSLFPNGLLKRTRRPGLGLAKAPNREDWDRLLEYGKRVRRIAYSEASSVISLAVFATINDHSPVDHILPNLQQLIWKSLVLEVGNRIPKLDAYLSKVCSLTQLTAFSFTSPTTLPSNFTDLLRSQHTLEKLELVAPGALSSQWTAVEGFFDDIIPSGANTPSDTTSSSGILADIRNGIFTDLQHVALTGEASNIAVQLTSLELDLSFSLRSLRITATGSSRFLELVRSTSRGGDPTSRHLPLHNLTSLPCLSTIFRDEDLQCLAKACPNIEMLRLCPMARFSPTSGPGLSLEGVSALTMNCRRLHTLALVTLASLEVSSSDPLHTTILLSHLAPHLEILKWFHEKNRPGFKVSDWLPHLQGRVAAMKKPEVVTKDQSVDATDKRTYVNKFAHVRPKTNERAIQMTQVKPDLLSVFVDATPRCVETQVDATPQVCHKSVGVEPVKADAGIDATPPTEKRDEDIHYDEKSGLFFHRYDFHAIPSVLPAVFTGLVAFAWRLFHTYPLTIPKHMLDKSLYMLHAEKANGDEPSREKHEIQDSPSCSTTTELLDHDIPPVCL
ncbi:hypothetical protein EDC04DRAFT_2863973 [Pisolithus marmoratus]|nr:hypothetical protein EDC04DRAFT_2863973 [Pisolithus marmoratus]